MTEELKDLDFGQLVDRLTWQVVQEILRGRPLRGSIFDVVRLANQWQRDRDKEKAN